MSTTLNRQPGRAYDEWALPPHFTFQFHSGSIKTGRRSAVAAAESAEVTF